MLVWIPIGLVVIATWHDLRTPEIPDWISLALVGWGCLATALHWNHLNWWLVGYGALLGLLLTVPLFYWGGIGGGDVKLMAGLGVSLGLWVLASTLFWTAIAGGVLAILAKLRGQRDFAYVPAILSGVVIATLLAVR